MTAISHSAAMLLTPSVQRQPNGMSHSVTPNAHKIPIGQPAER
ncbi:MAG: hypothetical protein WKG03_04980 [Telluria sp.]